MDNYNQYQQNRCARCGNVVNPGEKFCGVCGNSVSHQQAGGYIPPVPTQNPVDTGRPLPPGVVVSKREYFKNYAPASLRKELRNMAIVGYVLAGILAIVGIFLNWISLIDMVILLGLTLGMHLGRSKGCAIAILVYAIANCILGIILTGTLGGWGIVALGIGALNVFKKADKLYEAAMASRHQSFTAW